MAKFYFTFGVGHDKYPSSYHVIKAKDYKEARDKMFERFGNDWAFQYNEEQWLVSEEDYNRFKQVCRCNVPWHEGFTQAEMFGLREVK